MPLSYRNADIGAAPRPEPTLVRDLQADLRALGYLARGIDGQFSNHTQTAVRRLQYDLLHNDGRSDDGDGSAPIAMTAYNRGTTAVSGVVNTALADSIEALLNEPKIPRLPRSADPKAVNRAALTHIASVASAVAPTPYLLAIFMQESAGQHFAEPQGDSDIDNFIILGMDTNGTTVDQVTSRGYGLGQYTLFHHPPRSEEVTDLMLDPVRNAQHAFAELRDKFGHFLVGSNPGQRADDRDAEHPLLALRTCRYGPKDPRFMSACQGCAREARKIDIAAATPLYRHSPDTYGQATAYSNPSYVGVPDRADFQCDWPYAVRRYNGSGPNSFNYQAKVLLNLLVGQTGAMGRTA